MVPLLLSALLLLLLLALPVSILLLLLLLLLLQHLRVWVWVPRSQTEVTVQARRDPPIHPLPAVSEECVRVCVGGWVGE